MPVTSTEISKYGINVISFSDPNKFFATITLFNDAGNCIAFLRFYSPEDTPAANEYRADLGHPLISYPASAFQPMVDVLRNEKPMYFTWYDYRPVRCFGGVGTSREPVGEHEGI